MLNSITAGTVGSSQYQKQNTQTQESAESDTETQAAAEAETKSPSSAEKSDDTKVAASSSTEDVSQQDASEASKSSVSTDQTKQVGSSSEANGAASKALIAEESEDSLRSAAIAMQEQVKQEALFSSITAPMEESALVKLVSPAADRATSEAYAATEKAGDKSSEDQKIDYKI